MTKEIIIMAKSLKYGNYCIAGIDTESGNWVRLDSGIEYLHGAVPADFAKYADKSMVEVLDVVQVYLPENAEYAATPFQRENIFYDENYRWKKVGQKTIEEVISEYGTQSCQYIFGSRFASLSENELDGTSLLFLNVKQPVINVRYEGEKIRVKLDFEYNGVRYSNFAVTDMNIKSKYLERGIGRYTLGSSCNLVTSVGCEFKGRYYKLAAQIFTNDSSEINLNTSEQYTNICDGACAF